MLTGKRILLGVTGGIAAYKSAFLVREFVRAGAEVQVVMTRAAAQFITPLTMTTLSRREVIVDMFPPQPDQPVVQPVRHIDLALWGDVMLIAPATAHIIGKIAAGLCDDILSCVVCATKAPVLIAPAMNEKMYRHPVTQENIAKLKKIGYHFIGPVKGRLACGHEDIGHI